jgi:iron(III) transport system permease protein
VSVAGLLVSPHRQAAARRLRPPRLLAVLALAIAATSLAPLVYLIDKARTEGWPVFVEQLTQRQTIEVIGRSLLITIVATAGCVLVGVGAAVLVTRFALPGRPLWRVVLALPLAIPTYLASYAWVASFPGIKGLWGATLVLVACSYPYVFLPVIAALSRVDRAHEDVARSLGLGRWRTIWSVTLPQVRPAIASGALLAALYVLSDFGAVGTMRYRAFTWEIFQAYRAGFNPARAASLALVLVAISAVVVSTETTMRGRGTTRIGAGTSRHSTGMPLGRATAPVTGALVGILAVAVIFPVASIVSWFARSLDQRVEWSELGDALFASLRLSVLSASVTTALALIVGLVAARSATRTARTAEAATYLTHALPGVVIGISMIYLSLRTVPSLYQRTPVLVAAYVLLFLPLAVASSRAAIEMCPERLEEVSRSLGRSTWATMAKVTLRIAAPGLAAGAALTLLATMKELPATLILHPTGTDTLSMELWTATSVSDFDGAAPYALAIVIFAALPTALLGWLTGRLDGSGR